MPFLKVLKNKAYFKRFQVKRRRRREGKTDYAQRTALTKQSKDKYNSHKYRLVVRRTGTKVICQIAYATLEGDKILCQADSKELVKYGIKAGFKNYAAYYATGLLIARRVLKKLNLDEAFEGVEEADGEEFHIEEEADEEKRPFKCLLDVGLVRTSKGAKVFAAMKGAVDGGLHIPHNMKLFPGWEDGEGEEEGKLDADVLKEHILGGHVGEYMESMEEEDEEQYKRQFASYIEAGIGADDLEDMYLEAHKAIRENPEFEKKPKKGGKDPKIRRDKKITLEERKARVAAKIEAARERMLAAAEEDDE